MHLLLLKYASIIKTSLVVSHMPLQGCMSTCFTITLERGQENPRKYIGFMRMAKHPSLCLLILGNIFELVGDVMHTFVELPTSDSFNQNINKSSING